MQSIQIKKIAATKNLGKLPLRPLPKTLTQAAGLLKGKLKKTPLGYQKAFRKEW